MNPVLFLNSELPTMKKEKISYFIFVTSPPRNVSSFDNFALSHIQTTYRCQSEKPLLLLFWYSFNL